MAVFKVGDKVEAIDDVIRGTVAEISGSAITVHCDDGFPMVFESNELVLISGGIQVSNAEIAAVKKEKELPKSENRLP